METESCMVLRWWDVLCMVLRWWDVHICEILVSYRLVYVTGERDEVSYITGWLEGARR